MKINEGVFFNFQLQIRTFLVIFQKLINYPNMNQQWVVDLIKVLSLKPQPNPDA